MQEWFLPGTTASCTELPLQYTGVCGYTLVNTDGLLIPGTALSLLGYCYLLCLVGYTDVLATCIRITFIISFIGQVCTHEQGLCLWFLLSSHKLLLM